MMSDFRGGWAGGGQKLSKIVGHHLWMIPKGAKLRSQLASPLKASHARTSHTSFKPCFARTSHTCVCARTCACAIFFSQLTVWILDTYTSPLT